MGELRATGRLVEGIALAYSDQAAVWHPREQRIVTERVQPGALSFGDGVLLELEHHADNPLAMPPVLQLEDSPTALRFRAELPSSPEADAAIAAIHTGRLSGASIDFRVTREQLDGDQRTIQAAVLDRIALTDRPAYRSSSTELRIDQLGISGRINYEALAVIGMGQDADPAAQNAERRRGSTRKRRIARNAFGRTLRIPRNEVNLTLGKSLDQTIATRSSGALQLRETAQGVEFRVSGERIPSTSWARDWFTQATSGSTSPSAAPGYQIPAGGSRLVEERPGDPDRMIEVVTEARLTSIELLQRPVKVDVGSASWADLWLTPSGPDGTWDWPDMLGDVPALLARESRRLWL